MGSWKNCENCKDQVCYRIMKMKGLSKILCNDWEPMRCRCGGALSTIRYDKDGNPYRHCYSCHFEFEI